MIQWQHPLTGSSGCCYTGQRRWCGVSQVTDRAGRCYQLSGEKLWERDTAFLVHGSIQGMGNPRIDHAWVVTKDGQVWEPVTDQLFSAEVFQKAFHAKEHRRYTVNEANEAMLETGHYGPWEV